MKKLVLSILILLATQVFSRAPKIPANFAYIGNNDGVMTYYDSSDLDIHAKINTEDSTYHVYVWIANLINNSETNHKDLLVITNDEIVCKVSGKSTISGIPYITCDNLTFNVLSGSACLYSKNKMPKCDIVIDKNTNDVIIPGSLMWQWWPVMSIKGLLNLAKTIPVE